jgi:hypothetical protein
MRIPNGKSALLLGFANPRIFPNPKKIIIIQKKNDHILMLHKDDVKPNELSKVTKCFDVPYPNGKFLNEQNAEIGKQIQLGRIPLKLIVGRYPFFL